MVTYREYSEYNYVWNYIALYILNPLILILNFIVTVQNSVY